MQKIDLGNIINEIKSRGLTAYEISKALPISEVGINKILNGTSKTPRESTLTLLHNYLFDEETIEYKKTPTNEGQSMEDLLTDAILKKLTPLIEASQKNHNIIIENNTEIIKQLGLLILDVDELQDSNEELTEQIQELRKELSFLKEELKKGIN